MELLESRRLYNGLHRTIKLFPKVVIAKDIKKETIMEMLIGLFIVIVALDLAALRWGFDSRDRIDSPEWRRKRNGTIW